MADSDKLLADFADFCRCHPNQRFWQALRNWSGQNFILAATHHDHHDHHHDTCRDTFHWRGRDGIN